MKLAEFRDIIDSVNCFNVPYDVGVFRTEELVQQPIRGDITRWPISYLLLQGQGPVPVTVEDFLSIKERFKSVLVYVFYTGVPCDYYIRMHVTPNVLNAFKARDQDVVYDEYAIWRKTAGFYAGLGFIGDNRLFYSNKFGFKCKIELILTNIEFNEYHDLADEPRLKYCDKCPKHCFHACPVLEEENQDRFFDRCTEKITLTSSKTIENHCHDCVTGCPYSEDLVKRNIPMEIRDRRLDSTVIEWPFIPESLHEHSWRNKRPIIF